MTCLAVRSSKGQMKMQQMAMVLVAFVIFFVLVGVFVLSVKLSSVRESAGSARENEARALVHKLASTPEFSWTYEDCSACVDLDKLLLLKDQDAYRDFWGNSIGLIKVQRLYPTEGTEYLECTSSNYPECDQITIYDKQEGYTAQNAFVALCRLEGEPLEPRCQFGQLVAGVEIP
ncbi:MAG TPA: hypothetical protein VJK07_02525 [Candidatus Nanoarchaeia archaeon]|nr:hypothetical protein [Candidatus Nanoarchaeia archaeon]